MLKFKHVTRTRALLSPLFTFNTTVATATTSSPSCTDHSFRPTPAIQFNFLEKDVALSFKEWFKCRNNSLFDRIYAILAEHDEDDPGSRLKADQALAQLDLSLSQDFVLEVLRYGKDVLSCLKFFDWAGRQHGFHHTLATFNAIFKIMSRAKLMSLMLAFLDSYLKRKYVYRFRFYDVLVMGYAIAGKPEVALHLFGKMRFEGMDLDSFAYHVLLNALVEQSCFDAVAVVSKQISMRGLENKFTYSIMVKSFCKQGQLDEAEMYLRGLMSSGNVPDGYAVGALVDALCKSNKFDKAGSLLEEFQESGGIPVEHAYGVWIQYLVHAGKLNESIEFLRTKKAMEGYIPDVFRYNTLICRLLRENRLMEVCDLFMEMKENLILPDKLTMNAALCFLCKAGMVDAALVLYLSRSEFGLSLSGMAYNYLVNTLCGDGSIDEAYHVLKNSIDQGYSPGRKTFTILAEALCREGKLDKMKELVIVALEQKFMPSNSTYDKFISALCRASRVEDAYLIHDELNKINKVSSQSTYTKLIYGFKMLNRGDIAARLLIEMQEKGHTPTRSLFRAVIPLIYGMDNSESRFFSLLEMHISHHGPKCQIYNYFIEGAVLVKKPELAKEVFEMMGRNGIVPNLTSHILMLQSYLKSDEIFDALNFFTDLCNRRKTGRKLYNTMIVGLCKADKPDIALEFLRKMKQDGLVPSLFSYEELVKLLCAKGKYDVVVSLVDDLVKTRHHVSSFIGNVLLLHSLKTKELYEAWIRSTGVLDETCRISVLGQLIGAFSGYVRVSQDVEELVEVIEQCFPLDIYTYNMLLRKLSMSNMDSTCEIFNSLCQKGYNPNRWTFEILVHGFFKHGRAAEAKIWLKDMFQKGFLPTEYIRLIHLIGLI